MFYDYKGFVFGHPSEIELDIVISDSKDIAIEIKSSVDRGDIWIFERKIKFFEEKFNRNVDKKIIISPFVEEQKAFEFAKLSDIKIIESIEEIKGL